MGYGWSPRAALAALVTGINSRTREAKMELELNPGQAELLLHQGCEEQSPEPISRALYYMIHDKLPEQFRLKNREELIKRHFDNYGGIGNLKTEKKFQLSDPDYWKVNFLLFLSRTLNIKLSLGPEYRHARQTNSNQIEIDLQTDRGATFKKYLKKELDDILKNSIATVNAMRSPSEIRSFLIKELHGRAQSHFGELNFPQEFAVKVVNEKISFALNILFNLQNIIYNLSKNSEEKNQQRSVPNQEIRERVRRFPVESYNELPDAIEFRQSINKSQEMVEVNLKTGFFSVSRNHMSQLNKLISALNKNEL